MNTKLQTLLLTSLLPLAAITFNGCTTEPATPPPDQTAVAYQAGVPGGVRVSTLKETATVTAIDPATRKVTLVTKDGVKTIVKAGPEVANFAQIEVGDRVKATVREETVIFVRKPGEPSGDGAAGVVALAPLGEKPGGVMADTEEVTGRVTAVSLWRHRATLLFPDGTSRTFAVRPDVKLTKESVGVDVTIRITQAVAVSVEKP